MPKKPGQRKSKKEKMRKRKTHLRLIKQLLIIDDRMIGENTKYLILSDND